MQKKRRVFLAVSLPAEIKRYLAGLPQSYADLPAKWIPRDNLHITLLFLGDLTDLEVGEAVMAAKDAVTGHTPFEITLRSIEYGPEGKIPPRMLWAVGEPSRQLSALRESLEQRLLEVVSFSPDRRGFSPHVTLAKISAMGWRQLDPDARPEVPRAIELMFTVESVEVMESILKKGGPVHGVIESIPLHG